MAYYKAFYLLYTVVYFIVLQQQCLAKLTYGLEAVRLCQEYKKVCPRNKVCAIQTIHIHHEMKFPVCVHETNFSMLLSACEEAPNAGRCGAQFHRWYFNVHTASCSWFTYSGCGGNRNNFRSREECDVTCINQKTNSERKEIHPKHSDIQQGSLFYNDTGQATVKKPQLNLPIVHSSNASTYSSDTPKTTLYRVISTKNRKVHDVNKNSHTTASFVSYNVHQRNRNDSLSEVSNNAKKLSSQGDLKSIPKINVASFMEYKQNPAEYEPLNQTDFPLQPTYTEIPDQRNTPVKKKTVSNFDTHNGKINDNEHSKKTDQSIYGSNLKQQLIKTPMKSAYAPAAIEKVWTPSENPKANSKPVRNMQKKKKKESGMKRLYLQTNVNNQPFNFNAKRKHFTVNANNSKISVIFKKRKPYKENYKVDSEINENVKKKRKRKKKLKRKPIKEDKLSSSTTEEMHTTSPAKNQYYDQIQLFGILERKEKATIVPFS